MRAVAVGRLHDHVIRRRKILRILDERAVPRSDVSGKYDLALSTPSPVFSEIHISILEDPSRCPASTNRTFKPSQTLITLW